MRLNPTRLAKVGIAEPPGQVLEGKEEQWTRLSTVLQFEKELWNPSRPAKPSSYHPFKVTEGLSPKDANFL